MAHDVLIDDSSFNVYEGVTIYKGFIGSDCGEVINGGCDNTEIGLTFYLVDGRLLVSGSESELNNLDLEAFVNDEFIAFLIGTYPSGSSFSLVDGALILNKI
mgnify:FL=1